MNEGKFKIWFGALVLAIIVILGYRVLTVETKNTETLKAITSTKQSEEDEQLVIDNIETGSQQKVSAEPKFSEKDLNTVLQQLQPHQFHEDPYIEAKLLFEFKSVCNFNKQSQTQLCKNVLNRYQALEPLISDFQGVRKVPASTELGQLLKQGAAYDPEQPNVFRHQARELLKQVIKSHNVYVMSYESLFFLFHGVDYGEILPISQWLQSQDIEYNRLVLMYSLLKMAHGYESEVPEGERSLVVSMLCNWRGSVCDLSFDDYFEKELMPGMQKDVDLLIKHLRDFAAEN